MATYLAAAALDPPPPLDVGDTLEDLRVYFDAPDLELPEGMHFAWIHWARHFPTEEEFFLLTPADESFTLPTFTSSRDSPHWPILACKSLTPGSSLVPATNPAEWANAQIWLMKGHRSHINLKG
jgi:hypothetical protein